MHTILFKIKKFFLIILSFLFHILFDRKSDIISFSAKEDNKLKKQKKNLKDNGHFNKEEEESSKKKNPPKKEISDDNYLSIKRDINKVYFIEKYIDEITFRLKGENSYQELKGMHDELERYQEEIKLLYRQITNISTRKEEYQEFVEIVGIVVEKIKIDEKTIKINLEEKHENDRNPSIDTIIPKEEAKLEKVEYQPIINDNSKKSEEEEKNNEENQSKEECRELKPKEINQSLEIQKEKQKKEEIIDHILEEEIEVKNIIPIVKKSAEKKDKEEEQREKDTPNKDPDIGIYKSRIENIRNVIQNINMSKRRKIVSKVSASVATAALVLATLSPVVSPKKNNKKKLATALLINNKLRNSINIVSHKKKRNLKYEEVISKTQSNDASVNIDYILNDALTQIRQLRSILVQYGLTSEIVAILNQLDELETEMLEKINNINTKTNVYIKK